MVAQAGQPLGWPGSR
ncbi:TPA: hypothetical protein QCI19_004770 [Enterobacter ludwigii]|nr:hypothetical protein [Salmonella enterica subsp. enterica serovar Orion]QMT09071.1 hypothetical protein H1R18_25860 [Enterobacter kobei]HAK7475049.1 ash family protein [Salmonella enterica]HDR2614689.1 hypothetical protein [Enterobacter ludwigii]HAK8236224.1 ash family protein [Salmonella enterica]